MPFIGEISALGAAFLWSFSSFVFTAASHRISTIQLNISRMIIACILLVITIPLFGIKYEISLIQIFYLSLSGFIGLVIGDTFLFRAYKDIGPRISMLIMSCNPALAALLAYIFLGEILSVWGILGILITIAGISLVVLQKNESDMQLQVEKLKKLDENKTVLDQSSNQSTFKLSNLQTFKPSNLGIIFAFLAAAGQGTGLIFAKLAYLHGDVNGLVATFARILSAVIIMLPMALIAKRYSNPIKIFAKDRKVLFLVILGSIIGPYLGITFSFIAVINTKVGIASILMSTAPIIMLPLTRIFYKEKLSWRSIIGAFIAVGGVFILFWR
jgi:drug/metabolite transporter (DMT)-like permease